MFTERGRALPGRVTNRRSACASRRINRDAEEEPTGDSLEHIYSGSRHIQNFDGNSSYGERWHWSCDSAMHNSPLKSPNPDSSAQSAFNIANPVTPQRRTFINPSTEGDERHLYGQGKPMPKDSIGSGTLWGTGIQSDDPNGVLNPLSSRLNFDGTVQPTDLSLATDIRDKAQIGIFGSALSYRGSDGRVSSEPIGRDINPFGRGDGAFYPAGDMRFTGLIPCLPTRLSLPSLGNTVNGGRDLSIGSFSPLGPLNTGSHPGVLSFNQVSADNGPISGSKRSSITWSSKNNRKDCCYEGPYIPHPCPPQFTDVIPNPVYRLTATSCVAYSEDKVFSRGCTDNHNCVAASWPVSFHTIAPPPFGYCSYYLAQDPETAIGYAYNLDILCIIAQFRYCNHVCGERTPDRCSKYYQQPDQYIMYGGKKVDYPGGSYIPYVSQQDCQADIDTAKREIAEQIADFSGECNCYLSRHNFDWIEYGLYKNVPVIPCWNGGPALMCAQTCSLDPNQNGWSDPSQILICCQNKQAGPPNRGRYCAIAHTLAHEYSHYGAGALSQQFDSKNWPDYTDNYTELDKWVSCWCKKVQHGPTYGGGTSWKPEYGCK